MAPPNHVWLRICDGDRIAYEEIFNYYFNRYCNYGKKFTDDSNLIEDAAQEVMLTIWNKRESISSINRVGAYFYTSFRHNLFDKIKQSQKLVGESHFLEDPQFSIDHFMIKNELDNEIRIQLKIAIANLTDRQREAIFLRFYEELSYEEVSGIMNISIKATYKIMARALAMLKENFNLPPKLLLLLLCRHL
ncbi:MAG: RNA polymerase sigma factor [Ginsengibacter sp.]